ncbi:JAB domain-containing protein [Arachidicoccus terrestris]|uniref:JAB domain-containing protein n=1 Tax=Arachidicoccus terrestris TaxID=2875539 RepID=UPI001CC71A5C|nr:JAB domain-containing protein [Arachidicoccus terrestris]UAY55676.1 JAB domain-containing protein [Arachidicoccus terrestris]
MINNTNKPAFKVSEIQLSYNPKVKASERPQITQPLDAYKIFLEGWDKNKLQLLEQFKVMLVNKAHRVLGVVEIASGGIAGTLVDARLIFATALKAAATGIILCHCHPSGNLKFSQDDVKLTKTLKAAGDLLDIKVLDHLIITAEAFTSLADYGYC